MANKTVTVKASSGDYTSLNAALAGETANLVTGTCILTIECYTMEDTTASDTGTGYTTSSSYYINITTPSSERHAGKWSDSKYRLSVTDANAINVQEQYVRIDGLQIKVLANTSSRSYSGVYNNSNNTRLYNTIIQLAYSSNSVSSSYLYGIYTIYSITCWNVLTYDSQSYSGVGCVLQGAYSSDWNGSISYFYNCTFYGGTCTSVGWQVYGGNSNFKLVNCIAQHTATGYYNTGTWVTGTDYNVSDHNDAPGANSKQSATVSFVDTANEDFHLASGDTVAKDAGTPDPGSGLFSVDIDGETRSGTWDIGADEYVAGGAPASTAVPVFIHHLRQQGIA